MLALRGRLLTGATSLTDFDIPEGKAFVLVDLATGLFPPPTMDTLDDRYAGGGGGGELIIPGRLNDREQSINRNDATAVNLTAGNQTVTLCYFQAKATGTRTRVRGWTGSSAWTTLPTLVKIGIYSTPYPGQDLTLMTSTASDTTLFSTAHTLYERSLLAPAEFVAGDWYAAANLIVGTVGQVGNRWGSILTGFQLISQMDPRPTAFIQGQTDFPATILAASIGLAETSAAIYNEFLD